MSIVKHAEIECDRCRDRLVSRYEQIANRLGITKGDLTKEIREEAKAKGWKRRHVQAGKRRVPVDLCATCAKADLNDFTPWFALEERDGNA